MFPGISPFPQIFFISFIPLLPHQGFLIFLSSPLQGQGSLGDPGTTYCSIPCSAGKSRSAVDHLPRPQTFKLGAPHFTLPRRAPVLGPHHALLLYVDLAELGRINHSWESRESGGSTQRGLQATPACSGLSQNRDSRDWGSSG